MVKFSVSYNNKVIKTYELNDAVITIGRLPENKICISNMGISRRHSKIERDANHNLVLTDLNSLNGTFVNSKKSPKAILCPGDTITIGKYLITFDSDDGIEATSPPIMNQNRQSADETKNQYQPNDDAKDTSTQEASPSPSGQEHTSGGSGEAVLIETNKHVVYKLDKHLITLGAAENNDIFVSGFLVSDGYIEIERIDNALHIRSHKFLGKYKVNGKKKKSHILQHKDRIEIGSSVFRFMESG
jgi:pSer/pThr/pTyr-binding forkhead associated (FHA) protein